MNIDQINDFHIHLYYKPEQINFAKELVAKLEKEYSIEVGRFHEKNVGPHPMWSVQLLVQPENFNDVFSWVVLNKKELTVFTHPNTGNDLLDHTDHAIWMGEQQELDLSIF